MSVSVRSCGIFTINSVSKPTISSTCLYVSIYLSIYLQTYIPLYTYLHICICIYASLPSHIYREKERERERECPLAVVHGSAGLHAFRRWLEATPTILPWLPSTGPPELPVTQELWAKLLAKAIWGDYVYVYIYISYIDIHIDVIDIYKYTYRYVYTHT